MLLKRFYDEPLAQASFLLADTATHEAVVVDPNRDIEHYVRAAAAEKLTIVAVTETHIHADYLSGTRELAQRARATAYLSDEGDADWKYAWGHEPNVKLVRGGVGEEEARLRERFVVEALEEHVRPRRMMNGPAGVSHTTARRESCSEDCRWRGRCSDPGA